MSWRVTIARFFGLPGRQTQSDVKPSPVDKIDPIEELARLINEAQQRDAEDEGRFDDLARIKPPPASPGRPSATPGAPASRQ